MTEYSTYWLALDGLVAAIEATLECARTVVPSHNTLMVSLVEPPVGMAKRSIL